MKFKMTLILLTVCMATASVKAQNSNIYFKFDLKPGQRLGTMFMRTIAITGEEFTSMVSRVSGTGDYLVKKANADSASFTATFKVDGHEASTLDVTISDAGKAISYSGKKSLNHEGSGLAFNSFLWGRPPLNLKKGDSWIVTLDQEWESGGPGQQKVTVVFTDPQNHTICLRRDGDSEGFDRGGPKELIIKKAGQPITVQVIPGKIHWTGYTIFRDGLVVSDELMAVQPLILKSGDTSYHGEKREYMMLNSTTAGKI